MAMSSMSAFMLTHLLMLGKLAGAPLYQTDMDAIRDAFPAAAMTLYTVRSTLVGLVVAVPVLAA